MSNLLKTKWRHQSGKLQGVVTEHNADTGKIVIDLDDEEGKPKNRTYKGRVNNLKDKWVEVKP